MEYGLIQDTTMTAIADGLRNKGVIPATRNVLIDSIKYMTPNVTSDTDPTPTTWEDFDTNLSIPEATSLEVVCNVGTFAPGSYVKTAGHLTFAGDFDLIDKWINIEEAGIYTFIIPSNAASFAIRCSAEGGYIGVIADIYALDANGNRMQFDSNVDETNTISPTEMIEAINNMAASVPVEAFNITGDCAYRFANNGWNWFISFYGDKITTKDISSLNNAFQYSNGLEEIPFVLNVLNASNLTYLIYSASNLKVCPKIRGTLHLDTYSFNLTSATYGCLNIRDFEDLFAPGMLDDFNTFKITSAYSCPKPPSFGSCYSLRRIPSWWYNFTINEESTVYPSNYTLYTRAFDACYALDEAVNIPVLRCKGNLTSNVFSSIFNTCGHLKTFTFETIDGQPIETQWKSQTIDLTTFVGYIGNDSLFTNYNSGIGTDKHVKDDASYQALKNDSDWFTNKIEYSRYNHDSAVETINSLPDTSAYIASAGGTNTIKFKKASGSATDGGAIENLTAEEIAVATAKGWTVTLS
jgi:hypothetical protein